MYIYTLYCKSSIMPLSINKISLFTNSLHGIRAYTKERLPPTEIFKLLKCSEKKKTEQKSTLEKTSAVNLKNFKEGQTAQGS